MLSFRFPAAVKLPCCAGCASPGALWSVCGGSPGAPVLGASPRAAVLGVLSCAMMVVGGCISMHPGGRFSTCSGTFLLTDRARLLEL